jgi:hypothetical protein
MFHVEHLQFPQTSVPRRTIAQFSGIAHSSRLR